MLFPPLDWSQRQALFFRGAPLAILPALLFLPALVFLVLAPRFPHSFVVAAFAFPVMAALELLGLLKLARCCAQPAFDLLTALAFGALVVVMAIAVYTGLFLAVIIGHL